MFSGKEARGAPMVSDFDSIHTRGVEIASHCLVSVQ